MARRKLPIDAFEYYFALGHERSYQSVADYYNVSKTAVANLAEKEEWQKQVIDRERQARASMEKKSIETIEEMNERHLSLCKFIQKKAFDALRTMPLSAAMEAVRAVDLSIKQERLVRGEPTDRNAMNIEEIIKREYENWLMPVPQEERSDPKEQSCDRDDVEEQNSTEEGKDHEESEL